MCRPFTLHEMADKDRQDAQEQLMDRVYEKLGFHIIPQQLKDIGLQNTPQYDPHENETQNKPTFSQLGKELESTPEEGDHYTGAEIMLPIGDKIARGNVVAPAYDTSGNVMGMAHSSS